MYRVPLLLLLLYSLMYSLTAAAASNVYRTTDDQGNVVFTDTPPAGNVNSEQVDVQRTNTAPPPPDIPPRTQERAAEQAAPALSVAITSPANETTIAMGPGNFGVTAQVSPGLGGDERLQLLMDGEPRGEPQTGTSWQLTNVFRGAHDLSVRVLDEEGETLATSEPVRVYVLRPSINSPNRRAQ